MFVRGRHVRQRLYDLPVCGIVGILARDTSISPEMLERATLSLAHRGPDDSGTVLLRNETGNLEIGLGNRRLAILDLSSLGHQPMNDAETGNWIVYNGELYNFREVRQKLEVMGYHFVSNSDTEVVLKAYGHWGEKCLAEFRGMFAFAIWDAKRQRLFLARDQMGVKPVYYGNFGGHFLFASEVRTLLGTGLVPRQINRSGLLNYLSFGSLYDPNTLIEGVSALRAGHYLIWEEGNFRETKYWDLAAASKEIAASRSSDEKRSTLEENLCATLEDSVQQQMISDVPVGAFLSGGIDSSSLVGILARGGAQLDTFSIVFKEADYSEAEFSRTVARKFGTRHHELMVSQQDALSAIPRALSAMDLPTIDGFNTYLVSQQTRAAGVKVALSGLGADELFAGYSTFRSVPRLERFAKLWRQMPDPVRKLAAHILGRDGGSSDQNRKLSALVWNDARVLHPYFLARMLFTPAQIDSLCLESMEQPAAMADVELKNSLEEISGFDSDNQISYLETRFYMLNTLLRDSDVMSMAHGLEIRVPFVDHVLAASALALPGAWKLSSQQPKPLLVNALRGELPKEIVDRRKRGFTLPFEHWLRDEMRQEVETTLTRVKDGPLATVLNVDCVNNIWKEFLAGRTSWSRPWSLYVLQRWCELHSLSA